MKGEDECILFCDLVKEAVHENESLKSQHTFKRMIVKWNTKVQSTQKKVYFKTEIQLARHYKVWRMKQSKKEARQKVNLTLLYDALRQVLPLPERDIAPIDDTLQRQYLGLSSSHRPSNTRAENGSDEGSGVDDVDGGAGGDADSSKGNHVNTEVMMTPTSTNLRRSENKRKRWSYCIVEECLGGFNRKNCRVWKLANPTYEAITRKCSVCKQAGCPGHSNRTRCQSFGSTDIR